MLFLIAISLSADAFAVTISNLLTYKNSKMVMYCPLYFGIYQGIMPLIGYFLVNNISANLITMGNSIVFVVLTFIGVKMICEAIFPKKEEKAPTLTHKMLNIEAFATSIDALAVGVSLCFMDINIFYASAVIALTTFFMCILGIFIFSKFKYKGNFEVIGGIILIILGVKSLF